MTPEALLDAVDAHEVWLEADGTSVLTDSEHFGLSDYICEVTEEVRAAEAAGLIRSRPYRGGPVRDGGVWELTDAGRTAHALNRERSA